jgi:hypothetical protein
MQLCCVLLLIFILRIIKQTNKHFSPLLWPIRLSVIFLGCAKTAAVSIINSLVESSLHWDLGKVYVQPTYLCNFQDRDVPRGQPFGERILSALMGAEAMVAFVSRSYTQTIWTAIEVCYFVLTDVTISLCFCRILSFACSHQAHLP